MEQWGIIKEMNGFFEVSSEGRVRGRHREFVNKKNARQVVNGSMLTPAIDRYGYMNVTLTICGKKHYKRVHRLVAETFIAKPDGKNVVNHKNGIKTDNRLDNLEWVTDIENLSHAHLALGYKSKFGIPILQYDMNGDLVKEWENMAAAQKNGFLSSEICTCAQNQNLTHYGYRWAYKGSQNVLSKFPESRLESYKRRDKNRTKVNQLSPNGDFIKKW